MTQQAQLNTYHNKIHNINIYSILKKRNIHIPHTLRESLYTSITDIKKNIHTLHNNYIDNEIKLLLSIFSQLISYEINILDVILLFYTMDLHHLKNFIRFYNIQVIKDNNNNNNSTNNNNTNSTNTNNNTTSTNNNIALIDISEYTNKIDILHTLDIYSHKNIIHSLLIINFLKKYYFPNFFIHSS